MPEKKPSRLPVSFDPEIFIRGKTYWYRGTPEGMKRQIETSLRIRVPGLQKDVKEAKRQFLDSLELRGSAAGPGTVHFVCDHYLRVRELEAKNPELLSERTYKESKHLIENHLKPYCGDKMRIVDFDQKFFSGLCEAKLGMNFVNMRKVCNHMLKWAVHENYLKRRPEIEIPKFARKARREREVLTNEEITRMFKNADDKILLYIGMYLLMGMRNMEICKLRWDEIDLQQKSLRVNPRNNRRRKGRLIPINPWIFQNLKRLEESATSDWVFPSARSAGKLPYLRPDGGIRKQWLKLLADAQIDRHITPHDMRATFKTFMHMNTDFTDTQREKMAGAKIDVQKNHYVRMNADNLRGLESSVQVKGLDKMLKKKQVGQTTRAKPRSG